MTRMSLDLLRNSLLFLLLGLMTAPLSAQPPNVMLIMTDDQGYGDLGFHGNDAIRTPALDQLAAESTRFGAFYVSPVCAPTRSSLMTGRWTLRTGVFDTYNGGAIMATDETTIAEILGAMGYRTGVFGKWHLGDNHPSRPMDQGFQESLVHLGGGVGQPGDHPNYFRMDSSYFNPTLLRNGRPEARDGYCSDVYTDAAIEFIAQRREEQPFFLYLAFNAPHTPLQVPREYYELYAGLDSVPGRAGLLARGVPEDRLQDLEGLRRLYGMVTNIDDNVGRLLRYLDEEGLRENTLVIFLTDNGPQQYRYTAGLRERKGSVYEGGIRVPCFFRWPDRLSARREVPGYAAHIDIPPTILGLCGLEAPDSLRFDGRNLAPYLLGLREEMPEKTLFFQWRRGFPQPYDNVAVRRGPYKMVGRTRTGPEGLELYNLEEDPGERYDLSREEPQRLAELRAAFDDWLEDMLAERSGEKPRISVGFAGEDPVVLSRNDARGSPGIWKQQRIYGYWDIEVLSPGPYDARVHFLEPLGQAGQLLVRVGPTQRAIRNEDPEARVLELDDLPLPAGKFMLEAWYAGDRRNGDGPAFTHFPFIVELRKR